MMFKKEKEKGNMHIIFDICVPFFHKSNNLYLRARESVYWHFDPCCEDPEERFHALDGHTGSLAEETLRSLRSTWSSRV